MTFSVILAGVSAVLGLEPVKGLMGALPGLLGGDKGKRLQFGAVLTRQLEAKIGRAREVQKAKVALLDKLAKEDDQQILLIHLGLFMERAAEFLLEMEEEVDKIGDILENKDDDSPSR